MFTGLPRLMFILVMRLNRMFGFPARLRFQQPGTTKD